MYTYSYILTLHTHPRTLSYHTIHAYLLRFSLNAEPPRTSADCLGYFYDFARSEGNV